MKPKYKKYDIFNYTSCTDRNDSKKMIVRIIEVNKSHLRGNHIGYKLQWLVGDEWIHYSWITEEGLNKFGEKIENKLGEMVIYNTNLHSAFSPDFIPSLKVYSFLSKKFESCEYWGINENPFFHFGRISFFHFELNESFLKLYLGESLIYGYFKGDNKLRLFHPYEEISENFITMRSFDFENYFKVPGSMWDFANHLDSFLNFFFSEFKNLELEFQKKTKAKSNDLVNHKDDLPF